MLSSLSYKSVFDIWNTRHILVYVQLQRSGLKMQFMIWAHYTTLCVKAKLVHIKQLKKISISWALCLQCPSLYIKIWWRTKSAVKFVVMLDITWHFLQLFLTHCCSISSRYYFVPTYFCKLTATYFFLSNILFLGDRVTVFLKKEIKSSQIQAAYFKTY